MEPENPYLEDDAPLETSRFQAFRKGYPVRQAARSEICKAFEVLAESCTVTVLGAGSRRLQAATTRLRMEAETGSEGGVSQLVALADDASAMTSQLQSNAELSSISAPGGLGAR